MAAPTFVAAGTLAEGVGDIVPPLPSGWQENDILVILAECQAADTTPTATGYSNVSGSPVATTVIPGSNTKLTVLWKRATSSESNPTVTDAGNHTSAMILAIRGCPTTGNPWDVTATGTSELEVTSGSVPGATTTVADCLVLAVASEGLTLSTAVGFFGGWTNSDLTSVTSRANWHTTQGNDGGVGAATGVKATAGAYGATTFTLTNATAYAAMSIAFKPATGGATDLVIANAAQAQTADNLTLTQDHSLAVQDATQAQTSDNVTLAPEGSLMIQDASQLQTADNLVLTQAHNLAVQDAVQAQTADTVQLSLPSGDFLNMIDYMSQKLTALYPNLETNVGALLTRYMTDLNTTTWADWLAHVQAATSISNYSDASYTFWKNL